MMLKSIEALSKGFDPRGGDPQRNVRLKGYEIGQGADNSENEGHHQQCHQTEWSPITNDGYYTYVSGALWGILKVYCVVLEMKLSICLKCYKTKDILILLKIRC